MITTELKLYKHQEEALEFLEKNDYRGYIALPPGLGKTLIAAKAIEKVKPRKALILAPKSSHPVWQKELGRLSIPPHRYTILTYEKFLSEHKNNGKGRYTDFLILDEAHRIKNIKAKTTRLLLKYGYFKIPKILLSGTPFKELIDLYTQFFVINPAIFGRWKEFTRTYFEIKENPFGGIEYVPLPSSEKEILEKISPYFFRRERDEITELEKIEVYQEFLIESFSWQELKREVAKVVYEEIGDPELLELSEEEREKFDEEFVKLFAEKIKGKFIQFYRLAEINNKEKHLFIKEFVNDYPDTVIYTFFVGEAEVFKKLFDCYVITGNTNPAEREKILQKQDKPLVITSALSEGANLDNYGNLIFSTIPSSPVKFSQIAGRIDRLSQKRRKITYIYCIDEYNRRMLDLLKGRIQLVDLFTEIVKKS